MSSCLELPDSGTSDAATIPVPIISGGSASTTPRRHRRSWPTPRHLRRVALLILFILIPFGGTFFEIARSIVGGSPLAYLAVLPVLLAVITFGCSAPPRGVGDAEADWILAGFVGGLTLLLRYLMEHRFPTLSGLWHVTMIGAVVWAAIAATILFGVRQVAAKWPVWVFALGTVTPVPYLMITAWLGGSATASSTAAAMIGTVAVFLAGRRHVMSWRLAATAVCAALGVGGAVAFAGLPLLVSVVISAGVVPLIVFVALTLFGKRRWLQPHTEAAQAPRRSVVSITALAAGAAALLVLNGLHPTDPPHPARVPANWQAMSGLVQTAEYDFIHRYLGDDASFVRYAVPAREGSPQARVDVITDDNLEALRTFRDVIWYPADGIPNYFPVGLDNSVVSDARAAASDASSTIDATVRHWYAVTWHWQAGGKYQQVLVILNQDPMSDAEPPAPAELTLHDTLAAPALWLTRQQANPSVDVDPLVTIRAQQIISEFTSTGVPQGV